MEKEAVKKREKIFVFNTDKHLNNPKIARVIIKGREIRKINYLISQYRNKVQQIHYYGNLNDLADCGWADNNPVIKVFAGDKREIIRNCKILKEKNVLLCPLFPVNKIEDITFIISMGIALDLLYIIDKIDLKLALKILSLYLFDPLLSVPIEPFHAILMSKLRKTRLNIWILNLLFPPVFYYIDEAGVSEDMDNLKEKKYLYLIDWDSHKLKKTGRKNSLQLYFQSIPREFPQCMSCFHFDLCFSWGRHKKETCVLWKEVLGTLETNVNRMRKSFYKYYSS